MQLSEMDGPDWANLAPELIACIMKRIQMGHNEKGEGRRIVAFAGVCRSWRKIVLEEWKARFTLLYFPCLLRTPGPTATPLQCMLRKTRKSITMFQGGIGDEYFVLAARRQYRPFRSCYVISSNPRNFSTKGRCCKALLLSDFWRNHFAFREVGASGNKKTNPTLLVDFQEKSSFGRCFRRLSCRMLISSGRSKLEKATRYHGGSRILPRAKESIMNWGCLTIPSNQVSHVCDEEYAKGERNSGEDEHKPLSQVARDEYLTLESKEPVYDIGHGKWALDFKGRCTVPSIHNFQLLSSDATVVLQLGKLENELFTLDYASPLSALEAFSICVTSFATRSGLEP